MPVILSFPTKLHEVTLVFITETGMRNVKKKITIESLDLVSNKTAFKSGCQLVCCSVAYAILSTSRSFGESCTKLFNCFESSSRIMPEEKNQPQKPYKNMQIQEMPKMK